MKKRMYISILLCIIAMAGIACDSKSTTKSSAPNQGIVYETDKTINQVNDQTEEIFVYFVDSQVTKLKQSKTEIIYTNGIDKYEEVFKALQSNSHSNLVSLWNKIELNAMKFHEGVLTIDIHIPDKARLGSSGELLALDALKETMFQFEEIHSLELLIDGKSLESFMGHTELEHPISRNNP
ncbi:GerMN domain-containing protein [Paenibacillus yanchengensis]|uniref:GerMN domain-containing protein n=1 Tax=Paenibacillus yanchengensis TaxID=2035833 RepID=A0ABW4YMJ1_9BACL